jgi:hypothetical protein
MTDHQLSTRDLAARSDSDEVDKALERQRPTEDNTDLRAAGDQDFGAESGGSDASPTRERAAHDDPAEMRPAGTETDAAAETGGEPLGSDPRDARVQDTRSAGVEAEHEPLFPNDQSERFTNRWQEIQTSFVDQPRDAVAEADALVADMMQRLAASFSLDRERLEAQWDQGDDVSSEDLRVALTRYRSFFDRLLSA